MLRRTVLDFDPSRDGFAFANSFTWTPADLDELARRLRPLAGAALGGLGALAGGAARGPRAAALGGAAGAAAGALGGLDGAVRAVAQRWRSFGLCGGMALAAVERWAPEARGLVARRTPTASLEKDAVRALVRRRQAETLRGSLLRFGALWARARLDGTAHPPLGHQLARDVERVARQIEGGRPALLGLVGDAPDPFTNHQVVAFGVERLAPEASGGGALGGGTGGALFHVYDPNAPGQTRHVRARPLAADPRRTDVWTDLPTGPRARGCHLSTRPNWLATVLHVM